MGGETGNFSKDRGELDGLRWEAALAERGIRPLTPEARRKIAFLKTMGIDLMNSDEREKLGVDWGGNYVAPQRRVGTVSELSRLNRGEEDYMRSADLGRPNPQADMTSVAPPTLNQLSLRGLYQDQKPFSGFR